MQSLPADYSLRACLKVDSVGAVFVVVRMHGITTGHSENNLHGTASKVGRGDEERGHFHLETDGEFVLMEAAHELGKGTGTLPDLFTHFSMWPLRTSRR
jgi:hypothetical protein